MFEAPDIVEHDLLYPVNGVSLHLDDKIIDTIDNVYGYDLLDALQRIDDGGFLPKLSAQKNIGLHLNQETSAYTYYIYFLKKKLELAFD